MDLTEDSDLRADLRHLPVDSDSADAVAAIHVLEHFPIYEAGRIIAEWRRILKPGGKMILEMPCLDKVFGYVAQCVQNKEPMAKFMTLDPLYGDGTADHPEMAHRYGYFTEVLVKLLRDCEMWDIQILPPRYHFAIRDMRAECLK